MTTKSTTDTTSATIFNEQPIFIGRDTQALIYLCKDGLYAFVAPSMRDLYAAACAEPTIGPHHFAGLVEVIRVNGIHADRLRSEAQLSAVPATRPDITAAGVAMEFAEDTRMSFTTNSGRVRVDFFKPSGKWYGTASVDMSGFYDGGSENLIHEQFMRACRAEQKNPQGEWGHTFTPDSWLEGGGTIVCLKPYHVHGHPLMLTGLTWTMRGPTGD